MGNFNRRSNFKRTIIFCSRNYRNNDLLSHKFEYFLNARIVGGQIRANAWELLIAMLAMEAAFGIAGIVAAPIYYAYIKSERRAREVV